MCGMAVVRRKEGRGDQVPDLLSVIYCACLSNVSCPLVELEGLPLNNRTLFMN